MIPENNIRAYMGWCYAKAKESPDPSTQNAAIVVAPHDDAANTKYILGLGINRFPDGVRYTDERWERPLKYKWVEHAERNAIYDAARRGVALEGATMVCPWAACSDCARAVIQSGITRVVTHKQAHDRSPEFWLEEIKFAFQMWEEAGIELEFYDGPVGILDVRMNGELWNP